MKAAAAKRSEMRGLADLNSLSLINFIISDANVSGSPAQTAAREVGELLVTGAAISLAAGRQMGPQPKGAPPSFFLGAPRGSPFNQRRGLHRNDKTMCVAMHMRRRPVQPNLTNRDLSPEHLHSV